jgi:hypothetical protein
MRASLIHFARRERVLAIGNAPAIPEWGGKIVQSPSQVKSSFRGCSKSDSKTF